MPAVEKGVLRHLSVSQVEHFDETQPNGCPTRWYFENVEGRREEDSDASKDGTAGHALLAHWLTTGERPAGRVKMGKAVNAVIDKGELQPMPGQQVEVRFDGQKQRDENGKWIPLDREKAFWLGGVPWDGFVDQRWFFNGVIYIRDHKFTSDIELKAAEYPTLIGTIQMPLYALEALRVWPDATGFVLSHHYVSRKGTESKMRVESADLPAVQRRGYHLAQLVPRIEAVAKATRPEDVPFNRKACTAGYGCPWQSICPSFKERKVQFTEAELDLFNTPAKAAPPAVTTPPVITAPVTPSREPGEDDGDPTPAIDVSKLPPLSNERTAVLPPDAPPNDANAKPPESSTKKKAKSKKRDLTEAELLAARAENAKLFDRNDPVVAFPDPTDSMVEVTGATMPDCPACGACLNPENAAKVDGKWWKHTDCPGKPAVQSLPQTSDAKPEPVRTAPQSSDIVESTKPRPQQSNAIVSPEVAEAARAVAKQIAAKVQIQRVVIELGPETLSVLRALIGK